MKRTILLVACLALLQTVPLAATRTDSLKSKNLTNPDGQEYDISLSGESISSTPEVVSRIPEASLELEVDGDLLHVTLEGVSNENLDWIIYKPKGATISRITTSAKIEKIMIDSLEPGEYMLMVKDEQSRILYQAFTK